MCGICGIVNRESENIPDEQILTRMCETLRHRGPDDSGRTVMGPAGLAMRRLSIIDLSTGHQPIVNEDGSIAIVFNGEIYNHLILRKELEGLGHVYRTASDTETILHGYEAWGVSFFERLNGMFGVAIWDSNTGSLLLGRDRLGIKPLYYSANAERILFGSEIKAILACPDVKRDLDLTALNNYFTFEYIPSPRSIFEDIRKLEPGHWLRWSRGEWESKPYWTLKTVETPISEEKAVETLRALFQDSVKLRLLSDVPLGAFLSGGIDSSVMVGAMAGYSPEPVKTFSIGFKESSYNELSYARAVSRKYGTEHHEFILEADALALTEKLIRHLDEPFGDFSIFPTYLVSRMARKFVKVSLSGDGGDELFGGYDTYRAQLFDRRFYHRLPRVLKRKLIEKIVMGLRPTEQKKGWINSSRRYVQGTLLPKELGHVRWMVFLDQAEREAFFLRDIHEAMHPNPYDFIDKYRTAATHVGEVSRAGFVDVNTYLVDNILVKVDRMSMAASLEARVPYLDHRLVELAFRLPPHLKMRGFDTKVLLKKAFWSSLPPEVQKRGKQGFSIPIKNWIRAELKPMMLDLLCESRLRRQGLFNAVFIQNLIGEHLSGSHNHSHKLWSLMVFQQWMDSYGKTERNRKGERSC
ncbi:MAG TPA: asparagine synthase (glutamine-hydrolyzing) [bacterium]|nr:asparagine synthase (glutamine-hydrolyzing) [bacterium]